MLETETTLRLVTMGFDPTLGILHTDHNGRNSLALDVMEACRGHVDRWAINFIRTRTFEVQSFFETAQGQCKIGPDLRSELVATLPLWKHVVAPVIEEVVRSNQRDH
jgi:CRISP-associated protein Cas1